MKATEGTYYTDPTLKTNLAGAQRNGIYRGTYHFARPSTGSAAAQARYYVSKVGSFRGKGALPPVLDLEVTGGLGPAAAAQLGPHLARDDRATHRSHADPVLLAVLLDRPPRQRHELHPLPVVDRALHERPPAGPRWLADLDVLAADQQRFGARHRRARRHEPLQRQQRPAGQDRQQLRWRLRAPAVRPDRPGRKATALTLSASTVSPAIDQAVNFSGDLAAPRRRSTSRSATSHCGDVPSARPPGPRWPTTSRTTPATTR